MRISPLYLIKPSFLNLFMKTLALRAGWQRRSGG